MDEELSIKVVRVTGQVLLFVRVPDVGSCEGVGGSLAEAMRDLADSIDAEAAVWKAVRAGEDENDC